LKIIVGLGNPGKEYENTPHNVGFAVIDELVSDASSSLKRSLRFKARTGSGNLCGQAVMFVQPQTYMNESGLSVGAIVRYRKLTLDDVVVVSDDADLEFGCLRIRLGGGSGGHKGIDSLIRHLGGSDFTRVRIGVDNGRGGRDLVDHVLSPFSGEDREKIGKTVTRAAEATKCLLRAGIDEAMNKFNGRQDVENI